MKILFAAHEKAWGGLFKLLKQEGFLIGSVFNWKGLKEQNYLYTPKQLRKVEPELYNDCMNEGHGEGGFSANKTYTANVIKTEKEFL
jgi:hypothetical protein